MLTRFRCPSGEKIHEVYIYIYENYLDTYGAYIIRGISSTLRVVPKPSDHVFDDLPVNERFFLGTSG